MNAILDKLASVKLVQHNATLQSKVSLLLQQSRWGGMRGGGYFLITYGFLGNVSLTEAAKMFVYLYVKSSITDNFSVTFYRSLELLQPTPF